MQLKTIILLPHYNNTHGLKRTLKSINESVFPDVLIVDDGSDNPPQKEELSFYGGNLDVVYCDKNQGIEQALNTGLTHIISLKKYSYIARLDCGDTCMPNRFEKQISYMDNHPSVHLLGSHVDFVSEEGEYLYTYKVPMKHIDIRKKMFLKNCFIHPAVIFRIDALSEIGLYPTEYMHAEDYAFFFSMVSHFQTANLDEVLVNCEYNPQGISESNRKLQMKSRLSIVRKFALPNIHFFNGYLYNLALVLMPGLIHNRLKKIYYR